MIFGGSYGHAGALNYYRHRLDLPETYSFNGSYLMWAPNDINFENQILIEEERQNSSQWFNTMVLKDTISNPYSRDRGYTYYRKDPLVDVKKGWHEIVTERKAVYNFK